jgi:hypothetical protein
MTAAASSRVRRMQNESDLYYAQRKKAEIASPPSQVTVEFQLH